MKCEDWTSVLAEAVEGTGGPLTPEEVQWADEVLAGARSMPAR